MLPTTARSNGKTKKERLAQEIAKAVGAGRPVAVETVDFSDPNRPKTCLEVDFPIIPINQISQIEGNSGKPIYQTSKWWARRRSSVFRSMLLAAAMKAPDDPAQAAKAVWDVYYANHQKKGALRHLNVADIFMGGGTTIVEGSRLGMRMHGCDLSPVAWFVVKNEMARFDAAEVHALLGEIEAVVKPQIIPFYACDCPRGHKGKWTRKEQHEETDASFSPMSVPPEERSLYAYSGPEIIYTFWNRHGPCQITGCSHRTPILTSPVLATKTLTVRTWDYTCSHCSRPFDIEEFDARIAPGVPLYVTESETRFTLLEKKDTIVCPHCGISERFPLLPSTKAHSKKVQLTLLVHPDWLHGESSTSTDGTAYGGCAGDSAISTQNWHTARASRLRLLEVRGHCQKRLPAQKREHRSTRRMRPSPNAHTSLVQPAVRLRMFLIVSSVRDTQGHPRLSQLKVIVRNVIGRVFPIAADSSSLFRTPSLTTVLSRNGNCEETET